MPPDFAATTARANSHGSLVSRQYRATVSAPTSSSTISVIGPFDSSAYLKSLMSTTSEVWGPREQASCLPSRDQSNERMDSDLKSVS